MKKNLFFIIIFFITGCFIDFEKGDGKKYALIYGINNYSNISPSLRYAVNDAQAMESSFKDYGYEVTLRTESSATKSNISNDIANSVLKIEKEDTLLFYFSGHGHRESEISYIVPYDAIFDQLTTKISEISEVELFEWLKEIKTDKVLLVFDHCFSGAYIAKKRFFVMTASKADEYAVELDSIKHGLFTYYFLKGLANKNADINMDGHINFSEIFYYTENYVTNFYYDKTNHQTPQFLGNKVVEYIIF